MSKRAERRHQEERIRERKRPIAKRWAGKYDSFARAWKFIWDSGKFVGTKHVIDPTGFVKRERFIEDTIRRLAKHNKCTCKMCKRDRYVRNKEKFDLNEE